MFSVLCPCPFLELKYPWWLPTKAICRWPHLGRMCSEAADSAMVAVYNPAPWLQPELGLNGEIACTMHPLLEAVDMSSCMKMVAPYV